MGKNVRVLSGVTYPISSGNSSVMLNACFPVSCWHAKRFGVNDHGKILVQKTPDKIHVRLVESSRDFICEFDLRGVSW